jgi:hypothetical protein
VFSSEVDAGSREENTIKHLERFPTGLNHPVDKKSLKILELERILVAKVCQLLRNAFKSAFGFDGIKTCALSYCFIAFSGSSGVST